MEYSEMTDLTGLLKDGDDEGEPTSPHNLKFHNPKIFCTATSPQGGDILQLRRSIFVRLYENILALECTIILRKVPQF